LWGTSDELDTDFSGQKQSTSDQAAAMLTTHPNDKTNLENFQATANHLGEVT
jgi:predicted Zn-dependent protease